MWINRVYTEETVFMTPAVVKNVIYSNFLVLISLAKTAAGRIALSQKMIFNAVQKDAFVNSLLLCF